VAGCWYHKVKGAADGVCAATGAMAKQLTNEPIIKEEIGEDARKFLARATQVDTIRNPHKLGFILEQNLTSAPNKSQLN
jgi:hypothetical protein